MSNKSYGVLLVGGYRSHQENYAFQFLSDPRCRLVASADDANAPAERIELNQRLAKQLDLPYQDLETALQRTDVDLVSLCPEAERRAEIAVKCAKAGKHLYLDKPLAPNPRHARQIVEVVQETGVKNQMFSNVYCGWAQQAKQTLNSRQIGDLRAIHCDITFAKGHPGSAPKGKRNEPGERPRYTFVEAKPELFDIGVYAVSIINWLTQKRVKSLVATTSNYFFKEHAACDVEDFGTIVMKLEDETTASVSCGRFGWTSHPLSGIQKLRLVGTERSICFDAHQPRLEIYTAEPAFQPPVPHPLDPMGMWGGTTVDAIPKKTWKTVGGPDWIKREFQAFVDAIENDTPTEMTAELAAHSVEIIMAAYRSAATGRMVELD